MASKLQARKSFTPDLVSAPMPDLVEVQKKSYNWFIDHGLAELFDEVSPIQDFIGRDFELSFGKYYLDEPKFDEIVSKEKNLSFEAPLRVMVKLTNNKTKKVIEQEVYLGDFPLMTERGTFIINGIERAVVSQLIRSAGIFFTSEVHAERRYYGAKLIPNRGSWLEIETDANNVIWVKIDRKRKVAITALLRAFGVGSDEEILELFKDIDTDKEVSYIKSTLAKDTTSNESEGMLEVYKRIRPGDLATVDNAKSLIFAMFFNFDRYDFGKVGRYKINQRFDDDLPITKENRVLRVEDIVKVISEIIKLNISQKDADDIDHLGNRRVRAIGELVQNKFRIGLARMERIAKDRMSTLDIAEVTPNRLVNARPVIGSVKEFFMSSQLSQFMDQTNPLAELEHKRRLSAMGPGGLSRERAGFDVRDVHPTHYGRICPIATPEGPNIGLVGHLATYARVNEYGFIETPFRRVKHDVDNKVSETQDEIARGDIKDEGGSVIVKDGETISASIAKTLAKAKNIRKVSVKPRVTNEIDYLTAFQSENAITTAATTPIDDQGYFTVERAEVRRYGQPEIEHVDVIDRMDVAPNQIVSIATSLIPFLEHDDAVRALMGSNMQRQAVPCIKPDSPIVGTGLEAKAAQDSGHVILAKADGKVKSVQGNKIVVAEKGGQETEYRLNKFVRSNASTCINQRPIVDKGDEVTKGDVLADGPSIDQGELALGQNITVAYMAWEGYNYEDAIILSEKLVREDKFTSAYIEDFQVEVRDTKLGPEIVTSDIPNIGEEKLKDLDAEGVIRIGASVSSGDILVGKITPKGETELSAEEKLLRAIFGEKARDVRDSSLYLEHGEKGKVVDIKTFSRANGDKLSSGVIKMYQISVANLRKIQIGDKMAGRHGNKGVVSIVLPVEDMPFMADGTPVDIILSPLGVVSRMNLGQILETHLGLAAGKLGYKVKSPVLNGVPEKNIKEELAKAGYDTDGKMVMYDGRTGESFEERVTVGEVYMLKLNHMVEDKIHQRSIGPYSLITQQPLGGKAQFGGQRFGEMEVWALEAYGAAHTLQEILTIKSDDVIGRSKAYEAIIKGEPIRNLNIPESFNVLLRELNGLGLKIELINTQQKSSTSSIIRQEDIKEQSPASRQGGKVDDDKNDKKNDDKKESKEPASAKVSADKEAKA